MDSPIQNKVAESGLVTLDLEKLLPYPSPVPFDLAPFLHMGLILKEKEFREAVQIHDWDRYKNQNVAVFCSEDAIIPHWAYMLVGSRLTGIARAVFHGSVGDMDKHLLLSAIYGLPLDDFEDRRVVVKGCGDRQIGEYAFLAVAATLTPHVRSLMYGEPCSTVPVFKKK